MAIKMVVDGIELEMSTSEALHMCARLLDTAEIALFEGEIAKARETAKQAASTAALALSEAKAAGNSDQTTWARVTMDYANTVADRAWQVLWDQATKTK